MRKINRVADQCVHHCVDVDGVVGGWVGGSGECVCVSRGLRQVREVRKLIRVRKEMLLT